LIENPKGASLSVPKACPLHACSMNPILLCHKRKQCTSLITLCAETQGFCQWLSCCLSNSILSRHSVCIVQNFKRCPMATRLCVFPFPNVFPLLLGIRLDLYQRNKAFVCACSILGKIIWTMQLFLLFFPHLLLYGKENK